MCLSRIEEEGTAVDDIICYKFFLRRGDSLISPYQEMIWPKSGLSATLSVENGTFGKKVTVGLHAYINFQDALNDAKYEFFDINTEIYQMIIPKGTKYAIGYFGSGESIAAEKMIFSEKIN